VLCSARKEGPPPINDCVSEIKDALQPVQQDVAIDKSQMPRSNPGVTAELAARKTSDNTLRKAASVE